MDNKRFNSHSYRVSDYNNFSQRPPQQKRMKNRDYKEDYGGPSYGYEERNQNSYQGRRGTWADQHQEDRSFNRNQDSWRSSQNQDDNFSFSRNSQSPWSSGYQSDDSMMNRSFDQGRMDYQTDIPTHSSNYGLRSQSSFNQNRDWNPGQDFEPSRTEPRHLGSDYGMESQSYRSEPRDYRAGSRDYSSQRQNYNMGSNDSNRSSQNSFSWQQPERDYSYMSPSRQSSQYSSATQNWNPSQSYNTLDREHHRYGSQGAYGDRYQQSLRSDRQNDFLETNRHQHDHDESLFESMKNTVKGFFGKGPKGYQRSDERIREDVSEVLFRHPRIDASEIEVQVKSGVVTLMGTVPDRQTKRLAEDVVENCSGVSNVINQMMITSVMSSQNSTLASSTANTSATSSTTGASSTTGSRTKNVQ